MGSPNCLAWAGVRANRVSPLNANTDEPSAKVVNLDGPEMFTVIVFPVPWFVSEAVKAPVVRVITDPSEALSSLLYSLLTGRLTPMSNPQNVAGRVKGSAGTTSHLGPRARAGEAVTTPPNMPTRAPSATITPIRLTAIPPSRHHPRDRRRALSSTRRTRRGGHNRPCPLYHSLKETSTVL